MAFGRADRRFQNSTTFNRMNVGDRGYNYRSLSSEPRRVSNRVDLQLSGRGTRGILRQADMKPLNRQADFDAAMSRTSKHVTFKDPQGPNRKVQSWQPIVLNASKPPSLRRDQSETRIILVKKGLTTVTTALKPASSSHTFAPALSPSHVAEMDDPERVQFTVDMVGFKDREIYFSAKGRKLVVEGFRPENLPEITSRKVKETVTLPVGVEPDNLKVYRDECGILYFHEAWKF